MAVGGGYTGRMATEQAVAVAGTAVGSNTAFSQAPRRISVRASLDCFVAPTAALVATAADGSLGNDRFFVGANERRELDWVGTGFWVLNANATELPKVRADGWV